MNEQKQKTITRVGMWLATIGALEGSFWKVLLIAFHSVMIGVYVGELIVRKRAQKIFTDGLKIRALISKLFVIVLLGCVAATIVSWEVGYIFGKILGIFQGVSWGEIMISIPLISLIHAIPVSLAISILYSVFVFTYLKVGKK